MSLRVPTTTLYTRLEYALGSSLSRFQDLQTQVATGQRFQKLSDDVVGASTSLQLRSTQAAYAAYQRAGDDASAALGVADGALQTATTLLARAKDLAINTVNGAYGANEREATAKELASIRDQLADVANTQHLGRAVFGGHRAQAIDKAATGEDRWVGNTDEVHRQLSPSLTLNVNINGREVFGFGSGGADVFSVLERMEAAVRAGDKSETMALQADLDTRFKAVTAGLGQVGALTNRVTAAVDLTVTALDNLTAQRSQVEDVDLAEAMMKLSAASMGYQAALAAVAKGDLPSLASFLR